MMHFLKGGNWQRERSIDYLCSSSWEVQWEHLPIWERNIEGLPDRWLQIVEGKVRWGWTRTGLFLLSDPKADCVREGLWVW
jgi:hypothetical protein